MGEVHPGALATGPYRKEEEEEAQNKLTLRYKHPLPQWTVTCRGKHINYYQFMFNPCYRNKMNWILGTVYNQADVNSYGFVSVFP
jgi:hypothetical protein